MIARFVHIGDTHLRSGHPRNPARLRALDQVIDEGRQIEALAAWLYPGDLFDTRSSIEDRNAMAVRLVRMAEVAPVIVVPGNHDLPGDLDIFAKLRAKWPVIVKTTPGVVSVLLATGDRAAIAALPYPHKAGLVAMGVAKDQVVPTAAEALDAIFMQFATELTVARAAGAIPIFLGHVNVCGSRASTGQPQVGMEIEINPAHLQRLPVVYAGLSHIHLAQEIAGAVYAGSICRMSFGEIEQKSYVVVTCQRQGGEWGASYDRRPIDVAAMYHVEGELSRSGFTWALVNSGTDVPASWKGSEVRVRYRFKQSEKSVLSDAIVLAEFAEAARLEVEPIAVPDRELRAPEVAAARTLAEKLAAYQKVDALAPAVAEKLAALEHGDPIVVLANLQAALARVEAGEEEMAVA